MKAVMKALLKYVVLCLLVALPALAHGGVDDEAPAALPPPAESGQIVKTAQSGLFEVVIKYPEKPISEQVPLKIFISDFATNEPVNQAQVGLEFHAQNVQAKFVSVGLYTASLQFPKADEASLVISLTAGSRSDLLSVDNLLAPAAPVAPAPAVFPTQFVGMVLGALLILALGGWGYWRYKMGQPQRPENQERKGLLPLPEGPETMEAQAVESIEPKGPGHEIQNDHA